MALAFQRPVGAAIDVKELEYISALHQTAMPHLREDASIHDVDVAYFLKSRYGIEVSIEEVRATVLKGLGGGDDDEECIDLTEIVAVLLIPTLLKAARSVLSDGEDVVKTRQDFGSNYAYKRYLQQRKVSLKLLPKDGIIEDVLAMMMRELKNVTRASESDPLNEDLLRRLFLMHGEKELAHDDVLLKEMVACARPTTDEDDQEDGYGGVLDVQAFARALTSDVQSYSIENETKLTTNYFDVFQSDEHRESRKAFSSGGSEAQDVALTESLVEGEDGSRSPKKGRKKKQSAKGRVRTFASIDFVAETYRWKTLVTLLWTGFILTFFAYREEFQIAVVELPCVQQNNHFGCKVATSVIHWLELFAQLGVTGLLYVGMGSMGNDIGSNHKIPILIGMTVMCLVVVLFAGISKEEAYLHENVNYILAFIIGATTIILQFQLFIGRCLRSFVRLTGVGKRLTDYFIPSNVKAESRIKQAAAYKLNHMVTNALAVHPTDTKVEEGVVAGSVITDALLEYSKSGKKYIPMGGFFWTWKRIFTKELFTENGMWLSGRIMSGNASQILISVFVIIYGITTTRRIETQYDQAYSNLTTFVSANETQFGGIVNDTVHSVNQILVEEITAAVNNFSFDALGDNSSQSSILDIASQQTFGFVNDFFVDLTEEYNCSLNGTFLDGCMPNLTEATAPAVAQRERERKKVDGVERRLQLSEQEPAPVSTELLDLISNTTAESNVAAVCEVLDTLPICNMVENATEAMLTEFDMYVGQILDGAKETLLDLALEQEKKVFALLLKNTKLVVEKTTNTFKPNSVTMITIPMYVATGVAFLSMMYIVVTLIPSTSTTILKLRSGVIPTFRDPKFSKKRSGQHEVTLMLGFMFWGGLLSSVLVGVAIGFIVFLFLYQVTREHMVNFVAGAIGVIVTIIVKTILFQMFRCFLYGRGFYRKRPAAANVFSLALECTNIGLSILFVFVRMAKIIIISLLYVGRIDTPLLASGVGSLGPMEIDNANSIFLKTILAHEAHRHPYLETLGVMYLMKLHHGAKFAKTSGSCWRLLFVLTLMPWLRKYRVMARPALEVVEGVECSENDSKAENLRGTSASSR